MLTHTVTHVRINTPNSHHRHSVRKKNASHSSRCSSVKDEFPCFPVSFANVIVEPRGTGVLSSATHCEKERERVRVRQLERERERE